ncbi:MAG: hypothetical protein ACT4P5_02590, partial [Armatimonadota bacterium]
MPGDGALPTVLVDPGCATVHQRCASCAICCASSARYRASCSKPTTANDFQLGIESVRALHKAAQRLFQHLGEGLSLHERCQVLAGQESHEISRGIDGRAVYQLHRSRVPGSLQLDQLHEPARFDDPYAAPGTAGKVPR